MSLPLFILVLFHALIHSKVGTTHNLKGYNVAAKIVKWSENRIRDFFQAIVAEFGPYVRSHWTGTRCIDDKRGLPISKYEFDQTMRLMEHKLCAKWSAESTEEVPNTNGFLMMLGAVIRTSSLVAWSNTQHDKTRAIAVEVGFVTPRDLSWLNNLSKSNKR